MNQTRLSAFLRRITDREIGVLLRGDPDAIRSWTGSWSASRLALHAGVIIAGAGLYGAAMGWWRAPAQGLFVGLKFPLIMLLTAAGNALLNGMLAPLLGANLTFRQSFLAIVMSFAIASAVLASFSPLIAFVTWNAPSMSIATRMPVETYSAILLMHVMVIAFAGIVSNLRLAQWLSQFSGSRRVAARVLIAWLAGNLFLGSQLSWILRPFIGSPGLPVEFLRDDPLRGNFYEAVWGSLLNFLNPK
jgi:hypothetical protein